MKKVLFIANSDRHIKLCHLPYMKMFKENNYIVHVATNSDKKIDFCDKKIKINLKRNPFSIVNILAIFEIRKIAKKQEYDIISCHTPIGGVLGRVAVMFTKLKTKVFYTAHGFHFYKGSKLRNWLIYYNIEKLLSRFTDLILTMNEEDYDIAKRKFKCDVVKINGIGMDEERVKLHNIDLRKELNLEDKYIVTYIAEISKRKNQKRFLKALEKYDLEKENIQILLIGDAINKKMDKYIRKCKNVLYLSFRDNIGDYINMSDLIAFPSNQEGLPLSVLEAMYFNKMIIATDIRGCRDLIVNNKNGILVPRTNLDLMAKEIINYKNTKNKKVIHNKMNKYKIESVIKNVKQIYNNYLDEKLV